MTVLLPTDDVALYPAAGEDEHGWALPGRVVRWAGRASLQLGAGVTAVDATEGGGHGPFLPASSEDGQVFLPGDAAAADGMLLVTRGKAYTLSQVRWIADPVSGGIDCVVAAVSEVDQWSQ